MPKITDEKIAEERDEARKLRDDHFTEIKRARGIIEELKLIKMDWDAAWHQLGKDDYDGEDGLDLFIDQLQRRAERAERALAEARQGWTPVGEYLPENYEQVLCLLRKVDFPRTRYTLAWCKRGSWFGLICSLDGTAQNGEIPDGEITHWRPLPAPPEPTTKEQP